MQQVIIYRNPAEVMVWEFIMSSPNFFSLIVAVLSAIVVFVVTDKTNITYILYILARKIWPKTPYGNFMGRVEYMRITIAIIVGVAVAAFMWV